jgi:hypothetical protein
MATQTWDKRLCRLVDKVGPSTDLASFRNQFQAILKQAEGDSKFLRSDADLLKSARDLVEGWVDPKPPPADVAIRQWEDWYAVAKERVPEDVLVCIAGRLPKPEDDSVDRWDDFLLACTHAGVVEVLLDCRLLTSDVLRRLAAERASDLYRSATLDVLLDRGLLQDASGVLAQSVRTAERPRGLMSRFEVLVRALAASPGADACGQVVSFLAGTPAAVDRVLILLMGYRDIFLRLIRHLLYDAPAIRVADKRSKPSGQAAILSRIVSLCVETASDVNRPHAETASLALAQVRIGYVATGDRADESGAGLARAAADATRRAALDLLRAREAGREGGDSQAVLLGGAELYHVLQDYLRGLSLGTDGVGSRQPVQRAQRFERYMGSKQVIEQVLAALSESVDETGLRDSLEVALFNNGVREVGVIGEHVAFDPQSHQAVDPDIHPGEQVVIVAPGRRLGDEGDAMILAKTRVRAVES